MPDLRSSVLLEMLRVAGEAGADAVALQDGDRLRPLPTVLRVVPAREAAHTLLHAGERRLRALLDALRTAAIDEATWVDLDPERATLRDVDEPGDLDP
jgi:molybdopterin-guanine dinucleotide biosynthesis protein A